MQFASFHWLSHQGLWHIIQRSSNVVSIHVIFWGVFFYEMIKANSALRDSLPIYHLIQSSLVKNVFTREYQCTRFWPETTLTNSRSVVTTHTSVQINTGPYICGFQTNLNLSGHGVGGWFGYLHWQLHKPSTNSSFSEQSWAFSTHEHSQLVSFKTVIRFRVLVASSNTSPVMLFCVLTTHCKVFGEILLQPPLHR